MIISLTGFMGCGKSSIGKRLSELLCCRFIDLDKAIEDRTGRRIPEIFEYSGEEEFRRIEKETLEDILVTSEKELILALGGGAVMTPGCEVMVHSRTSCVYLRASVNTLMEHLSGEAYDRPLLASNDLRSRISELMSRRSATYERTAHLIIDTDGKSIDEISEEIVRKIKE